MKKLTSVILALGISGGLVFAKFVYQEPTLDAANIHQIETYDISTVTPEMALENNVTNDLLVSQVSETVELRQQFMINDMSNQIAMKLNNSFE